MDMLTITGIDRIKRPIDAKRVEAKDKSAVGLGKPITDRLELTTVRSGESRTLLLDSIKARIRSGYYNRDAVAEDITDKLAKIFES